MKTNYEKLLPFWLKRQKLITESNKLHAEGDKLHDEGDKLWTEGNKLWEKAISKIYGNSKMNWADGKCILSDGTEFNRRGVEEVLLHLNWDKI